MLEGLVLSIFLTGYLTPTPYLTPTLLSYGILLRAKGTSFRAEPSVWKEIKGNNKVRANYSFITVEWLARPTSH